MCSSKPRTIELSEECVRRKNWARWRCTLTGDSGAQGMCRVESRFWPDGACYLVEGLRFQVFLEEARSATRAKGAKEKSYSFGTGDCRPECPPVHVFVVTLMMLRRKTIERQGQHPDSKQDVDISLINTILARAAGSRDYASLADLWEIYHREAHTLCRGEEWTRSISLATAAARFPAITTEFFVRLYKANNPKIFDGLVADMEADVYHVFRDLILTRSDIKRLYDVLDLVAKHEGYEANDARRVRGYQAAWMSSVHTTEGSYWFLESRVREGAVRLLQSSGWRSDVEEEEGDSSAFPTRTVDGKVYCTLGWMASQEREAALSVSTCVKKVIAATRFEKEAALRLLSGEGEARDAIWNEQEACLSAYRSLHPEQQEAIRNLFRWGVLILSGGAGTGKSTVLGVAVLLLSRLRRPESTEEKKLVPNVLLLAPTGNAAKRLLTCAEKMGGAGDRRTIHSFVLSSWDTGLAYVVDELSMQSVDLAARMFDKMRSPRYLLLCGDTSQLPPVSPGAFLRDLWEATSIGFLRKKLTVNHRQGAEGGDIATIARGIQEGTFEPGFSGGDTGDSAPRYVSPDGSVEFIIEASRSSARERVLEIVRNYLGEGRPQVIGNRRDTSAFLNKRLQMTLNPARLGEKECVVSNREGARTFRVGDVVVNTKNFKDPDDKFIANGDVGVVTDIGSGAVNVTFDVDVVPFRERADDAEDDENISGYNDEPDPRSRDGDISHLEHAYCVTAWKFQGNETQEVIGLPDNWMLTRELLYTMQTRAKKKFTIVFWNRSHVKTCLAVSEMRRRVTFLGIEIDQSW